MGTAIDTPPQLSTPVDAPVVAAPALPGPRKTRRRWPLAAAAALLVAAAALALGRAWPTLFSPPAAPVVRASGRIEGRDVTLAAKTIQGRVKRLLADEGQTVTKGELLAELDAAQLEAQLAAASATVAGVDARIRQASVDLTYTTRNSEASIAAAEAALSTAQAHVLRTRAILGNSMAAYERASVLFKAGAISTQERDEAEMTLLTSRADVAASEKEVARAEANVALARASTETISLKRHELLALEQTRRTALANLQEAQANLDERFIRAPENGTIVSRPVEVGDVVTPGAPMFQLIDMNRLYVKVYIPEPDIPKLRLGDPAEVFVDAFPGRSFTARISKIYDQAEFTPKNVETAEERLKLVFGVELTFVNPNSVLKPGMPADCVIHWTTADGAPDRHGS